MTNLLEELINEYDYKIANTTTNTVTLYKSQYLDDGYGYYFDAEIELTVNVKKDEVTKIKIDGYTEKQINKLLRKEISKCKYQKKFKCCVEECSINDEIEIGIVQDCNDCTYLTMIESLYQCIDSGNW